MGSGVDGPDTPASSARAQRVEVEVRDEFSQETQDGTM